MKQQLIELIKQDKVYFECRSCGKSLGTAENLTGECECGGTMVRPYFFQKDILEVKEPLLERKYQRLKEMIAKLRETYDTQEERSLWVEIDSAKTQVKNLAEDLPWPPSDEIIKLITDAGKEEKIEVEKFENFELNNRKLIIHYKDGKTAFQID